MGSSYKGTDYFGSGPHRFVMGKRGRRVISLAAIAGDAALDGASEFGDLELRIEVRGRLVGAGDSALWALRDAISAQADSEVGGGTLEDLHGRSWDEIKLLSFEERGPVSRGRVLSVGYVALFGRLASG